MGGRHDRAHAACRQTSGPALIPPQNRGSFTAAEHANARLRHMGLCVCARGAEGPSRHESAAGRSSAGLPRQGNAHLPHPRSERGIVDIQNRRGRPRPGQLAAAVFQHVPDIAIFPFAQGGPVVHLPPDTSLFFPGPLFLPGRGRMVKRSRSPPPPALFSSSARSTTCSSSRTLPGHS